MRGSAGACSDKAVSPVMPSEPQSVGEYVLLAFAATVLSVCCLFPLLAIVVKAWSVGESWRVLMESETWQAVWNTLRFSAAAVFAAAVLGVVYAAAARGVGVDARADVFAVYGVMRFVFRRACCCFIRSGRLRCRCCWRCMRCWRIRLWQKRCFVGLGRTAAGLRQGNGRFWAQTAFRRHAASHSPLLKPALRRGLRLWRQPAWANLRQPCSCRVEWQTLTAFMPYLGRRG